MKTPRYALGAMVREAAGVKNLDLGLARELEEEGRLRQMGLNKPDAGTPFMWGALFPLQRAGLDTKTSTAGAELQLANPNGFEVLAKYSPLIARVQKRRGVWNPTNQPVQNAHATATWADENPVAGESVSALAMTTAAFSRKTLVARTTFSKQLARVSGTADVEGIVTGDLQRKAIASMESAIINGDGVLEPMGLRNNTAVGTFAFGTHGGAPTAAQLAEIIRTAEEADVGNIEPTGAWLTSPRMRERLTTTERASGNGFLMQGGRVMDFDAMISPAAPHNLTKGTATTICSPVIFGKWDDYAMLDWGNGTVDITVDPYTMAAQGLVAVTAHMFVDAGPLRPESFIVAQDAR